MANWYLAEQVQTARAAAALPAAGAYDAAPVEMPCPGFKTCTLFVSYTRAAAGGDVTLHVEASPDAAGATWHRVTVYDPGAVASGADTTSNLQRENLEYGSTGAGAEEFIYGPFEIHGAERLRVACAETGAIANPGTVSIEARFAGEINA